MTVRTLGVSEDHEELAELALDFARYARQDDTDPRGDRYLSGGLPESWSALIETGLHSVHIEEEFGGGGAGIVELAIVVEQLAAELYPGPLLPTVSASAVLQSMARHHATPVVVESLKRLATGATAAVLHEEGLRAEAQGGTISIKGRLERVPGGRAAEMLIAAVRVDGTTRWVLLRSEQVRVEPAEAVDLTRDLGTVIVEAEVGEEQLLPGADLDEIRALIATLRAAEASGIAAAVTDRAVEHAKLRSQFGKPLSAFQAIQQRLSLMYAETEISKALVWDMARAEPDRRVLITAGATSALARALRNTFDYVMTLGAIGFTWEHEAHLYWRRVLQLGVLEGPQASREYEQGLRSLRDGVHVAVAEPDDLPELRREVQEALAAAGDANDGVIPGSPWAPRRNSQWQRTLAEHRLVAAHLPEPYGRGADALAQAVILEEFARAGLTPPSLVIGDWVAPTIAEHGTPEQQERFLPPTLRSDIVWCQLFSEPGAGSDLGSVATRAERVEGGWRVTGQKIWNSIADIADWGALLVRTDPEQRGSRGLSYFLVEMSSPGIEIRPIRQATGTSEFCEVFLTDVFVPDDQVIGDPSEGWRIATTTLSNERLRMGEDLGHGGSSRFRALIANLEEGTPLWYDAVTALGRAASREYGLNALAARGAIKRISGGDVSSETSVLKLANIFAQQEGSQELIRLSGPESIVESTITVGQEHGTVMDYLGLPAVLLGGGTPEIQLSVIAFRVLGLR